MGDKWDEEDEVKTNGSVKDTWEDVEKRKIVVKAEWDDEDDDDVKDSWDLDEPVAPKTTKPKADAAAPKETAPAKEVKELTEEEKKEAQLQADLNNATELFGLGKSLDLFSLSSKDDLKDYVNRLYSRLNPHNKNALYCEFLDETFKTLCKDLPSDSIRKLSNSLKLVADAKFNEEKSKSKDGKKPAGKKAPKIKLEADRIKGDFDSFLKDSHQVGYAEGEDDDFM